MNREEKVHRAISKQGFYEKMHDSFMVYVLRTRTAVGFFIVLLGVAVFTGSLRATCLAAAGMGLGLASLYALWFAVMYFLAYLWTWIVRWIKKTGP